MRIWRGLKRREDLETVGYSRDEAEGGGVGTGQEVCGRPVGATLGQCQQSNPAGQETSETWSRNRVSRGGED